MPSPKEYKELLDKGYTEDQIAKKLGVVISTVKRAIRKFNEKEKNKVADNFEFEENIDQEDEIQKAIPVLHTVTVQCKLCGKSFDMSPAEQKFYINKGYELPKRCPECRKNRKKSETHICVDCNAEFEIKNTEKEFFIFNGLHLPQRCPNCRKIKREFNNSNKNSDE